MLDVDGEVTAGAGAVGVVKLSGFPDSWSKAWHRWSGLGGELRAVGTGRGHGDSAVQIGPVAMAGTARFDGEHPLFSLYGRVAPMIGVRERDDDASFEYGGFVAVGATLGGPEHLDSDTELGPTSNDTGPLGLGLELTAGWMRGAVFVGAGIGLVLW